MEYKCDICNKSCESGYRPTAYISPMSCLKVCDDHMPYRNSINVVSIQKRLGIISDFPEHLKKCLVCKKYLSQEELSLIDDYTVSHVCLKHIDIARWHQSKIGIRWCEFKELHPDAFLELNHQPPKRFYEWLQKNPILD